MIFGVESGMRFIVLATVFALVACSSQKPTASPAPSVDPYANGRAIFTTGRDLGGNRIWASPAPQMPACIDCHRANGSGGLKFPENVVSADLRHKALVEDQKHPYTIRLLMRAISTGIDNEGEKLSPVMPRWRMSALDLHDIAAYVYDRLK